MKTTGIGLWSEITPNESHKLLHRFTDLIIVMNPEVVNQLNNNQIMNYPYILDWSAVSLNAFAFPEIRQYIKTKGYESWDDPPEVIVVATLHWYTLKSNSTVSFEKTIHTTMFDVTCKRKMQIKEKQVSPIPYLNIKTDIPPEEMLLHWHPYMRFLGKSLANKDDNQV